MSEHGWDWNFYFFFLPLFFGCGLSFLGGMVWYGMGSVWIYKGMYGEGHSVEYLTRSFLVRKIERNFLYYFNILI